MAAVIVSVGIVLSRVLGFARELAIASLLGVGDQSSLYETAFTIPDWLTFLVAGGYLSITLVPLLSRHLADDDEPEAMRTFTAVFRFVGTFFALFALVTVLAAGVIVRVVFSQVSDQAQLTSLTRVALASQVFFGLGALLMAAQYARRSFVIPSLAPLVYNGSIVGGGLLGWLTGNPSPAWFLWGGLVGAATGNFALQWFGARRAGFRLVQGVPWRHRAVREYLVLAFPLMIGVSAVGLDEQWPRLFGQYAETGAAFALGASRSLNMLPVGMIAQAAGVAAYPFLAGLAAEGRTDELNATVVRSVRGAVAASALAAGVLASLTVPAVAVTYGHGKVTAADVGWIGLLLFWYSISIPFWSAHQVYTRGFYAMRRMWTPVLIGSAVTAVTVPMLWVMAHRWGAAGIAGGSTVSVGLYTVAIGAAWHRLVPRSGAGAIAGFGLRALAAAAATAGAGYGLASGLDRLGAPSLVLLAVVSPFGAVVFLAAARVLGLAEINDILARLYHKARARLPLPAARPG